MPAYITCTFFRGGWGEGAQSRRHIESILSRFCLNVKKRREFPPGLDDRTGNAWEALFAIANVAEKDWAMGLKRAPKRTTNAKTNNEIGTREILLADLPTGVARC